MSYWINIYRDSWGGHSRGERHFSRLAAVEAADPGFPLLYPIHVKLKEGRA